MTFDPEAFASSYDTDYPKSYPMGGPIVIFRRKGERWTPMARHLCRPPTRGDNLQPAHERVILRDPNGRHPDCDAYAIVGYFTELKKCDRCGRWGSPRLVNYRSSGHWQLKIRIPKDIRHTFWGMRCIRCWNHEERMLWMMHVYETNRSLLHQLKGAINGQRKNHHHRRPARVPG